jgi:hypothetical protein
MKTKYYTWLAKQSSTTRKAISLARVIPITAIILAGNVVYLKWAADMENKTQQTMAQVIWFLFILFLSVGIIAGVIKDYTDEN